METSRTECIRVDPATFERLGHEAAAGSRMPPCEPHTNASPLGQNQPCTAEVADLEGSGGGVGDAGLKEGFSEAERQDLETLRLAGQLLREGRLVAMPTETVYGLAADATNNAAVRRIFAAKGRPADNPLIVHVSSLAMLRGLYPAGWAMPEVYAAAVSAHWPGPLTILLPRRWDNNEGNSPRAFRLQS